MSINNVILTGRAGRDPEVRYFESGSAVASLAIAVDRYKQDEPDWFDLELWGKLAQAAGDYVRKGSRIGIIGRLEQQKWTDRATGEKRSKVLVKVVNLELLDTRADQEARQQRQAQAQAQGQDNGRQWNQPPAQQGWQSSGYDPGDEEAPF